MTPLLLNEAFFSENHDYKSFSRVAIFRGLDARGGRKLRTDTQTHTHTHKWVGRTRLPYIRAAPFMRDTTRARAQIRKYVLTFIVYTRYKKENQIEEAEK